MKQTNQTSKTHAINTMATRQNNEHTSKQISFEQEATNTTLQ